MSKYDALCVSLKNSGKSIIVLTFPAIEQIIGGKLPKSAKIYEVWWDNTTTGTAHTQSENGWLAAGYTASVDLANQTVTFTKKVNVPAQNISSKSKCIIKKSNNNRQLADENMKEVKVETAGNQKVLTATDENGKELVFVFEFVDDIRPERDQHGKIIEYRPQNDYEKRDAVPLNKHGEGSFCKFSIKAEEISGVYLWVENDEIIYIGEAVNFKQRFNTGYGNISPKNCYEGGQPTNCKMNKVALEESKKGHTISIYFYATPNHKAVEKILLSKIDTPHNVKDN